MIKLSQRVTEKQNRVNIADRMWARLLSSTNQPAFIDADKRYSKKESKVESKVESDVESEVTNEKKEELEVTNEKKEESEVTNKKKEETETTNEKKEETETANGAIIPNDIEILETKAD